MPYGSICYTCHQLKYSSPNRSNPKKKDKSHTKEPTFRSENGGLGREKEVRRMGQKAEKEKTERATGLGRKNKRGDME